MERKYFKPKSLTWWASFIPVLLGVVMAWAETVEHAEALTFLISLTGQTEPYVLINAGLAGIGIRGAFDA